MGRKLTGVGGAPQTWHMAYVATNYKTHPKAPVGQWVCSPTVTLGPFSTAPTDKAAGPNYCGQCVSYVKTVCPTLPATGSWVKGDAVKDNKDILPGTVIATFDDKGKYLGHAAIYVSQNEEVGISVYDQWVTPPSPKAIGPRTIKWNGAGTVNNGNCYFVVD